MSFLSLVKRRRSVRDFTSEMVPEELLQKALKAVQLAPSAVNYQPYRIFVIEDKAMLAGLYASYPRPWFAKAACCVVFCAEYHTAWVRNDGKNHGDIDVAIAADHFILAASELGLGSCWVCNFDEAKCREAMGLDETLTPVVIVPVGFSESAVHALEPKQRKSLDELVTFIK